MMRGVVSPDRDPVVVLRLRGRNGREEDVQAVVDTGFRGYIVLPPDLVARLGYPVGIPTGVTLAGNVQQQFATVVATVYWDGQVRDVSALQADGETLVGMSMLNGYRLMVDSVPGGDVLIEAMP